MSFHLDTPVLTTDRLILRAPVQADFAPFAEMLASARTGFMGGPFSRADAMAEFTRMQTSWATLGFGGWIVTERATGAFLGETSITKPDHFPEPELGWSLTESAEGHGYAFEAAIAARDWFWAHTDGLTLVSYVTPGNTRSEALAAKLGAQPDATAPLPTGETRNETTVYRHLRAAQGTLTAITLTTRRLDLRPPTAADIGAYSAFYAVTDIAVGGYRGGRSDAEVRAILDRDIAHWADKGFGMFLLRAKGGSSVIGGTGLAHPGDWPSHELTWWLMPDARGQGFATEASRAVIAWAYDTLRWDSVETHMRDENAPARKLAKRLGGRIARRDTFPDGVTRDVFTLPAQVPA